MESATAKVSGQELVEQELERQCESRWLEKRGSSQSESSCSGENYNEALTPRGFDSQIIANDQVEEDLPSQGSSLHKWGACKPCAFVARDGCQNGKDCPFCHLCEPGEKKRRKKERLMIRRETRDRIRKPMFKNAACRDKPQRGA
jgi:hypothetical protein